MPKPDGDDLRRSDPEEPGIRRIRCGKGFRYVSPDGSSQRDEAALARIKALVIPPAWTEVWICADEHGHLQAVGTDAAGRRQYRYHDVWREQRDREKFDRMLDFAAVLPKVRAIVQEQLRGRGYGRERILATAVRLLDLGLFRVGGEEYAEENGTYGLATVLRDQVRCGRSEIRFEYPAKGSKDLVRVIAEPEVCKVVRGLKNRDDDGLELLAHREGKAWRDIRAADINDHLREISGGDYTAKDFRTWHATVLAAVGLAVSEKTEEPRKAINRVVEEVAGYLGNTPAVARESYIDPRVIECFEEGRTIRRAPPGLGEGANAGEAASHDAEEHVRRLLRRLPGVRWVANSDGGGGRRESRISTPGVRERRTLCLSLPGHLTGLRERSGGGRTALAPREAGAVRRRSGRADPGRDRGADRRSGLHRPRPCLLRLPGKDRPHRGAPEPAPRPCDVGPARSAPVPAAQA